MKLHSTAEQEAVATWPVRFTQHLVVLWLRVSRCPFARLVIRWNFAYRPGRYRFLFCS